MFFLCCDSLIHGVFSCSNVVHFRTKDDNRSVFKFKVGNLSLEYKEIYKYLGVTFHEHGLFVANASLLANSAGRALGALTAKYKQSGGMGYGSYTKLYDACIVPVMSYGAEIWGYTNYPKLNQIHQRAMRIFLGVHKFAPIAGLEGDMGWIAPKYRQWLLMLSYWNRLNQLDSNRLTYKVFLHNYNLAVQGHTNWCSQVLSIFDAIGIADVFDNRNLCDLKLCKDILLKKQEVEWQIAVTQKPKLRFYALFKSNLYPETYVKLNLTAQERSILAQLRLGILPIKIETGRFNNLTAENRICEMCSLNVVEDECHFLFNCERYDDMRNHWIDSIRTQCHDFDYMEIENQLSYLFDNLVRTTAKYVIKCFNLRKSIIYE